MIKYVIIMHVFIPFKLSALLLVMPRTRVFFSAQNRDAQPDVCADRFVFREQPNTFVVKEKAIFMCELQILRDPAQAVARSLLDAGRHGAQPAAIVGTRTGAA